MSKIAPYLSPKRVVFLDAANRDDALSQLVEVIAKSGKIKDKEAFYKAIIDREKIVSTGISMGVAIPHAKLPDYDEFFIAVGILNKGVDWGALDGTPVRIIFMIGGPDDQQTEYLQILSALTVAIKDEERRKTLLQEKSPEKIVELFKAF